MMKSIGIVMLFVLAGCAGVSGNGSTEMYGDIKTGITSGRTTISR